MRTNRPYVQIDPDVLERVRQIDLLSYLREFEPSNLVTAHRDFFLENMMKCRVNDCYHRAFFYVMGIASETRANINQMFNFKEDCIEPEGMHGGWQTSGTVKVCHLAFNLWNGYAEEGRERYFTPDELFCCEFAPYFMEGIKVRYPEYCRELPTPRKQTEISR